MQTRLSLAGWQRFWLDRDIEVGRLAALRVVFFGLLGLDLLVLMSEKAYRYGTGGFNVAHFDALDALLPLPNAVVHTTLYLLAGFLSLRIAAGVAVKTSLRLLTVFYGYTYFSSLHDGYQHHYLIAWILLIFWAIPLEQTGGLDAPLPAHAPAPPRPQAGKRHKTKTAPEAAAQPTRIKAWGVSLLYAQVCIVYMFTALAKHNPDWWNGWALKQQISTPWVRHMLDAMSAYVPFIDGGMYAVVATSVFAWQFIASLSFVMPRLRAFACITGPLFHVMVEVIGLEIRWFSYYMIALYYLLLFPDVWYSWVASKLRPLMAPLASGWAWLTRPLAMDSGRRWGLALAGALAIGGLCLASSLPGATPLALSVAALVLLAERGAGTLGARSTLPRLALQLVFALAVVLAPRVSGTAYDYYRNQGGDLSRRGETDRAIEAYYHAIALNPGPGSRHQKLGNLLMSQRRFHDAAEVFEAGLRAAPGDAELRAGLKSAHRMAGAAP